MSNAYLSPIFQSNQFGDDDTFLAGGLLWFYQAGTTTPILAYTGPNASIAWSNPIQLNSRGETGGEIWLATGQAYKMILEEQPEYGQTHGVVISSFDNISGVNDPGTASAQNWIAFSGTPTYVSATSFTVTGDQRQTFLTSRRLKTTNSAGTVYSTVVSATYSTNTTVVVSNDYGENLDSGLSAVSYGFIQTGNVASIPNAVIAGSPASGSQHQLWLDYNGTNLTYTVDAGTASANFPINAATATAAASNSFSTQQTASAGLLNARMIGQNDVSLTVTNTGWGLLQQGVGYGIQYTAATNTYSYGGFTLPTQTGTNGYSKLPNGMILQWGYASATSGGTAVTFPTTFTSASSYAVTTCQYGTATTHSTMTVTNTSASTFTAYQANGDSFYYIAMGY